MIEDISKAIVKLQLKNPKIFMLFFVFVTLALLPGITLLVGNVEPSLEKVLPSDISEVKLMNDMRTQFGADMMYLLVYTESPVTDVRYPDFVSYLDMLTTRLRTRENIVEATSLADIVRMHNKGIIPNSQDEIAKIISLDPTSLQFHNHDYSFAVIRLRSDTGSSAQVIKKVVDEINADIESLEANNPGSRIEITGFNAIDKATFEIIMSDFAFITVISMILVGIVVLITFRKFLKGMLPMVVVMTAITWTMGIAGYLNLTITVVTMVAAAMIMGLGIDFGIHIVHGFYELRKKHSIADSITETMKELLRAMVAASLTTMAGFLALLFGVLPAMKTLGMILAIGIFNTLLGAVLILPILLVYYERKTQQR